MLASASFLSKIFGSVNWTAPDWLHQLRHNAKQRLDRRVDVRSSAMDRYGPRGRGPPALDDSIDGAKAKNVTSHAFTRPYGADGIMTARPRRGRHAP